MWILSSTQYGLNRKEPGAKFRHPRYWPTVPAFPKHRRGNIDNPVTIPIGIRQKYGTAIQHPGVSFWSPSVITGDYVYPRCSILFPITEEKRGRGSSRRELPPGLSRREESKQNLSKPGRRNRDGAPYLRFSPKTFLLEGAFRAILIEDGSQKMGPHFASFLFVPSEVFYYCFVFRGSVFTGKPICGQTVARFSSWFTFTRQRMWRRFAWRNESRLLVYSMSIAKQVATGKVPVVSSRRTSNKAKMPLKMATYIAARSLVTKKDEKKTADEGGRFLYNIYLLKEQLFKQRVLHISLSLSRF